MKVTNNKFIVEQLNKIKIDRLLVEDNVFIFKKCSSNPTNTLQELSVGNLYKIKVENYVLNPPPGFTLSSNWNNNTVPPEQVLNIEILELMGKMVKCKCVGTTTNICWEGWLPRKSFSIIN